MPIELVVSDVDGTMVTDEKNLTPATIAAAGRLARAGIPLALVSSRPPRGMAFLMKELGLTGIIGGFNGAVILRPDGKAIVDEILPDAAVRTSLDLFERHSVDAWVFADDKWVIWNPHGDYVPTERNTIRFEPTIVASFAPFVANCSKVVGSSGDFDLLARCEDELQAVLGDAAQARRSQRYYLDVTNPSVDKGTATRAIARYYNLDVANVCAIGDQRNDLPMFQIAGHSVAMGNAPYDVAASAKHQIAASNEQDGWAQAIDRFVLSDLRKS